jgi:hypothetical protein
LSQRTLLSFCVAAVVAVAFTVCDYLLLHDIIPNRGPRLTGYDLVKTGVALCLAVGIVASITADGRPTRGTVPPDVARPGPVVLNLTLAAAFVLLFVASPAGFNWLGSEDNIVEYLSAAFGVAGAVFFAGMALAAWHLPDGSPNRRLTLVFAALCAFVLFVLGMEEISWGQRILGFDTPEGLAGNRQGEVNLHNFFTTPVHTIYRLGSWAALVLLPFMVTFGPRFRLFDTFHHFLPPPWIAAMSAPVACFNSNAWPFLPTQVVAFSSALMMAIFWLHARRGRREAALLFGAATLLIVVAQAIFLLGSDRFVRHWDVTEYQEFFMALGLAALGWAARKRVRARSRQAEAHLAAKGL